MPDRDTESFSISRGETKKTQWKSMSWKRHEGWWETRYSLHFTWEYDGRLPKEARPKANRRGRVTGKYIKFQIENNGMNLSWMSEKIRVGKKSH